MTSAARTAAVAVALLFLVGCGDDGSEASPPGSPTSTRQVESPAAVESPAEAETPAGTEPAELEDGRHPAYVTAIDVAGGSVTVDVIQFLTGAAAVEADSPYQWWAPFWLTLRDGQVTAMESQYIP